MQALRSVTSAFRGWGSGTTVTRPLADGSQLTLRDRTLEVLHRPGHSPSDTVFWDAERELLLGGDHLIQHISSNPLVARPLDGAPDAAVRPQALRTYIASLTATRELPARIVLSGHGEPVTDHRALIDERFGLTERRAAKILRLLDDAARDRTRDRAADLGQRRRHAGVPDALGGARAPRPAVRRGRRARARRRTASSASRRSLPPPPRSGRQAARGHCRGEYRHPRDRGVPRRDTCRRHVRLVRATARRHGGPWVGARALCALRRDDRRRLVRRRRAAGRAGCRAQPPARPLAALLARRGRASPRAAAARAADRARRAARRGARRGQRRLDAARRAAGDRPARDGHRTTSRAPARTTPRSPSSAAAMRRSSSGSRSGACARPASRSSTPPRC